MTKQNKELEATTIAKFSGNDLVGMLMAPSVFSVTERIIAQEEIIRRLNLLDAIQSSALKVYTAKTIDSAPECATWWAEHDTKWELIALPRACIGRWLGDGFYTRAQPILPPETPA